MLRSFSQAYNDIKQKIIERNPDISVFPNSFPDDLFITPQSIENVRQTVIADYTLRSQSIDLILEMLSDNDYLSLVAFAYNISVTDIQNDLRTLLENHASNYSITRKQATFATGTVYYIRNNVLTLAEGDKSVLRGSIVTASNGQKYVVQADTIMYAASGPSYFDPDLNAYDIPVAVQALNVGTAANAPAQVINKMETAVDGFDYVINKDDISNANDIETDESLASRIKEVYLGNNVSTRDGYKKTVLTETLISDVYVAYAGDPFMIRDEGYGGKIDLYVLESNIIQQTEIVNTASEYYILQHQPVDSLISITGHGGAPYAFEPNIIGIYEGSIRAQAKIHWTDFGSNPPTVPYTVKYNYNSNVELVQALLDKDQYKVLAGSEPMLLVKQSIKVPIDIIFSITIVSGSKASIIQDVITAITSLVDGLKLGESLQQSDVISTVYTISGVDSVVLPMTKFNRTSLTGIKDTIEAQGREYLRLSNIIVS